MRWLATIAIALASPAWCATYVIDSEHTHPGFEIDHLGFSTQRGQFDKTTGAVEMDELAQTGRMEIHIDAASLNTGLEKRDDVLKGNDWFQVERHPEMIYRSDHFVFANNQPVAVEGFLTMLGQTHPLRLEITRFKCGLNLAVMKRGCGADAQARLLRSDFGMRSGLPFVGDEVRLNIQVEAYLP
jgi:polyisoprenoid-binding protein YceI